MTMPLVALCADVACLQHPETVGLVGESFASQEWLRLFSSAEDARRFLRTDRLTDEVWVVSSEEVAPINLAATLKQDRPDRAVCLLTFQDTGSLKSRGSAAGIDMFLTRQAFLERYAQRKRVASEQRFELRQPQGSAGAAGTAAPLPAAVGAVAAGAAGLATVATPAAAGAAAVATASFGASPIAHRSMSGALPAGASSTRTNPAFLVPIVSGSGGAGKSTVATLAALMSQSWGFDTVLVDFDLQFGDVPNLLGIENPLGIEEVLGEPARLAQLRCEGDYPALLAAPKRLESAEAVMQGASEVLDQLMGRFDVIICNTGASWAEQHAVLLERSSKALFLVDQRPSSLRACQHALDLCTRCGIATNPFLFVLNRCSKGAALTSIDASCALRGAHVAELKDGGRDVEELLGAGMPQELMESRNDLCISLERLLLEVLPNAQGRPREDGLSERGFGLRLLKGKRPRKRKRGASCR